MSIGVESSRVTTEVEYGTIVDSKPTQEKLKNMGNAGKRYFWNNRQKQWFKVENEKIERQIIHINNSYIPLKEEGK